MTVPVPIHYYLHCESCSVDFKALVATSEEELLYPDWDDLKESVGDGLLAERFREYWDEHHSHVGLSCIRL
jgi:hypothetical protein